MKKILSIALVALLATASVFAGLSGKAKLNLGYDFESESYGFSNGKSFGLDLDLSSETVEKAGEGDIYAGVKATMTLKAADLSDRLAALTAKETLTPDEQVELAELHDAQMNSLVFPKLFVKDGASTVGLGLILSLKEAYVAGADWKVSITGTQNGPDFAKSAIDSVPDGYGEDVFGFDNDEAYWNAEYKAKSYKVSVNKAPGFTVTYKDWSVAAGFNGGKSSDANKLLGAPDNYFNYHVSAISPALTLSEGLTVKAGAVASGVKNATKKTVVNNAVVKVYDASKNFDAFGASAEVAYASDLFSAKAAADFGMKKTAEKDAEFKPGFDATLSATYAPATLDVYYQYGEKDQFISLQAKADLSSFNVPVAITAYGKDITVGKTYGGKVEATLDAIKATLEGSYKFSTDEYSVGASAEYKAELFTVAAGLTYGATVDKDDSAYLRLNASVETDKLVPGATLSLAYGPNRNTDGSYSTNLLKEEYGTVDATCTIKF